MNDYVRKTGDIDIRKLMSGNNIAYVDENCNVTESGRRIVDNCNILSEGIRLSLLYFLKNGERNVGDIADYLGQSQPAASNHLAILREAGFLVYRIDGKEHIYSIADQAVPACKGIGIFLREFSEDLDTDNPTMLNPVDTSKNIITPDGLTMLSLLQFFSHEMRLRIGHLLRNSEKYVKQMFTAMNESQPAVSHHLILEEFAWIFSKRKGGKFYFYNFPDPVRQTFSSVALTLEHLAEQACILPKESE